MFPFVTETLGFVSGHSNILKILIFGDFLEFEPCVEETCVEETTIP